MRVFEIQIYVGVTHYQRDMNLKHLRLNQSKFNCSPNVVAFNIIIWDKKKRQQQSDRTGNAGVVLPVFCIYTIHHNSEINIENDQVNKYYAIIP